MLSTELPTDLLEQSPTPEVQAFDYGALDTETRIVIQQRTSEIKSLMRRTATDIIDIGIRLTDVKEQFGHGYFRNWLKAEFNWSISAATKFMQVSEQFKCVNFTHLNITASALYLLAAPSIPKQARGEALERATQGEAITHTEAKAIVTRHKKAALPKVVKPVTVDVTAETVETSLTTAAESVEAPQTMRPKELQLSYETGGNPKQQRLSLPVTDPPTRVAPCFIEETSELLDEQSSDELNKRAEQLGLLGIGAQVRLNVKRNHSKSADVDDDSEADLPRKPISVNTRDICTLLLSTVQYLSSEQIDALWQALAHRIPSESRCLHHWKEAELQRIIKDAQHELNSRYHPEYFKA